jgi:hypothetical protein
VVSYLHHFQCKMITLCIQRVCRIELRIVPECLQNEKQYLYLLKHILYRSGFLVCTYIPKYIHTYRRTYICTYIHIYICLRSKKPVTRQLDMKKITIVLYTRTPPNKQFTKFNFLQNCNFTSLLSDIPP